MNATIFLDDKNNFIILTSTTEKDEFQRSNRNSTYLVR
jgi:hypothetical protein